MSAQTLTDIEENTADLGPAFEGVLETIGDVTAAQNQMTSMAADIREMRAQITAMRAAADATARSTAATQRNMDRVMPDGDALAVRVME